MRFNKKASLEIGVNTIVILVIAMMLLGLGIGFVKSIFDKAGGLPELIDTDSWENPPTSSEPIKLTPSSIEIKRGKTKDVKVGIYNKGVGSENFAITIPACSGPGGSTDTPELLEVAGDIEAGTSKGFKVIVTANKVSSGEGMDVGKYICSVKGTSTSNNEEYDAQFIMEVTS